MKTRRKYNESDEKQSEDDTMAPRPEDSPVSSPRTRSPDKGARTGSMNANPNAMSMLTMLAEVASVTLHTDPSVTDTNINQKSKSTPPSNKKPSDFEILTLEQVAGMTDNSLIKLFAEFESNEMWKRFTYTCRMLPAACSKYFQSFGSEHKARSGLKAHLQSHLRNLLEVHASPDSRQTYVLESIPARNRRLTDQEPAGGKRRTIPSGSRSGKTSACPKVVHSDGGLKVKRLPTDDHKEYRLERHSEEAIAFVSPPQVPVSEPKLKRKLDNREGKVKVKKPKNTDVGNFATVDDCNNNNNNNEVKSNAQDVLEPSCTAPMQEIVSHDHGYLKASSSIKPDIVGLKDPVVHGAALASYKEPTRTKSHLNQVTAVGGDGGVGNSVSFCIKENTAGDQNTLLHQHMNQELEGEIMAQDSFSDATPLPVVGSEVEFTPDQPYKVMRSADLPVVYDHNDPATNVQTVSRIIERDEYKVRKKPKGRAKFIGQSKVEKEMALKLITEIRSQSVMALDTLECKICHPPRLFTALSTLLSHYRSHAGIRPYECRICEAVFTRQHSLNYHMLIHTNQTRFTCVDCGRKFRHPSHFKEHRRRHTGESPYECSDCQMRFKTRNTYKRHLRTRHGKLLTTQGAIIILSQEEADRMKKTQGRKPRRPRQPLQIISPETAAQIEEEQIWTDFEEGDREEDDDEDEEEEEGDEEEDEQSPLDLTKKSGHLKFDSQVSPQTLTTLGVHSRSNGKTGLMVRSTKVNGSKGDTVPHLGIFFDVNGACVSNKSNIEEVKPEIKEEPLVPENVVDSHTYIFQQPMLQHNSGPKVNVKSSWNTVNIDLQNVEAGATSSNVLYCDQQTILETKQANEITEQVRAILPSNCSEIVGDIIPEEVITICAGSDTSGKDVDGSPMVESQISGPVVKPDWFTVKKPLKCYGRPGYAPVETGSNILSGTTVTTNHVDSHGHGVYFIVQGQDGRLAKVYQGNASNSFFNPNSTPQHEVAVLASSSSSPQVKPSPSIDSHHPLISKGSRQETVKFSKTVLKPLRDQMNILHANSPSASSRVVFKPIKALNHANIAVNSTSDSKVIINKQVVSNVVLKNHIVQNGNLVKVKCEERDHPRPLKSLSPIVSVVPVSNSLHSSPIIVTSVAPVSKSIASPSVIVTSVASVPSMVDSISKVIVTSVTPKTSSISSASGYLSSGALPPVSVQSSLPEVVTSFTHIPSNVSSITEKSNQKVIRTWQGPHSTENVRVDCVNGNTAIVENKTELNPLVYTDVDNLVTIGGELLLENVEIIESISGNANVGVTVNGIVEKDGIVKLEREFKDVGTILENGSNILTFSNSNRKVESNLDAHTPYVKQVMEEQLPLQANPDSSSSYASAADVLPITQTTQRHIVSIPPPAMLKI